MYTLLIYHYIRIIMNTVQNVTNVGLKTNYKSSMYRTSLKSLNGPRMYVNLSAKLTLKINWSQSNLLMDTLMA